MTRPCKYGCGTELGAFDEENRKYLEAASGGLHTKERCQEAKAKLEAHNRGDKLPYDAAYDKSKDDHGNELVEPLRLKNPETIGNATIKYVDHTLKPEFLLEIFTDPTPEGLKLEQKNNHGNEFIAHETKKATVQFPPNAEFVDHTLKPELILKTLTDPTPEGIDLKYNNFAKEHKIRYSQSHVLGSQYTVYVWYEEKQ